MKCSKISWKMDALTLDFRKHSGPTPADDMAAQIITDCGNVTLDFKQHGFCASPLFLQTLGPWYPNEMQTFTFIWKEDFGPLSNSPVLFLLSPGKMLLTMFLFQKWLGSSFPEDVWVWWLLMHSLQLKFTPCEALPSVWIGFAWQYSQACGHPCCLWIFSYPISSFQSTLYLICFDTALLEQPPHSVMILCDLSSLWRVSMIIFWTIAKSCSPLLWFQRTRYTWNLYCMDDYLLKLKCKYSNIWRHWFLTFISCKLKLKQKKHLKCFTLHVMNLKYMKLLLFEISYKKKITFSPYSIFFRCTCRWPVPVEDCCSTCWNRLKPSGIVFAQTVLQQCLLHY